MKLQGFASISFRVWSMPFKANRNMNEWRNRLTKSSNPSPKHLSGRFEIPRGLHILQVGCREAQKLPDCKGIVNYTSRQPWP